MRLTEEAKNTITVSLRQHFSQAEKIILFASHTEDSKRCGDIDILAQTSVSSEEKLRTLAVETR